MQFKADLPKIRQAQSVLGGKVIPDPYPYITQDSNLWVDLLAKSTRKGIGLYGTLMKLRAIGATLEKSEKFGYVIKPLLRGNGVSWGWQSIEVWNEEKKNLLPYKDALTEILREL